MALTKLKKVSNKRQTLRKRKKGCKKTCKTKVECLKNSCDKIDKQLWQLNWTYNKLIAQINREVIVKAIKHGKIDKKLFDKTKKMFLDKPHKQFYDLFADVRQKTFKIQMKKKLKTVDNAIKAFSYNEKKAKSR